MTVHGLDARRRGRIEVAAAVEAVARTTERTGCDGGGREHELEARCRGGLEAVSGRSSGGCSVWRFGEEVLREKERVGEENRKKNWIYGPQVFG